MMTEVGKEFDSRDSLCERIDMVMLEFFTTLTDLYKEQSLLEQMMKSGFLSMSRARYSMGIRSVGIHQCDENRMNASFKVKVTDNDLFVLENITNLESQMSDFDLKFESPDTQSNIRKRNVGLNAENDQEKKGNGNVENIGMKTLSKEGDKTVNTKAGKILDPIKWFGLLVPASLRQSQKDFRSTVDVAVIVANLKTKLKHLQDEYVTLLKKKQDKFPR